MNSIHFTLIFVITINISTYMKVILISIIMQYRIFILFFRNILEQIAKINISKTF